MFKVNKVNPGPGTYDVGGIKPDGVYVLADHKRTKSPSFRKETLDRGRTYRMHKRDFGHPGPGWYEPSTMAHKIMTKSF